MKRIITSILLAIVVLLPMSARDMISRNVNDLPVAAQAMIKKYFPKAKINLIKIDTKTFGGTDYEVILNNGAEIEFDKTGNWTEVDCGRNAVPADLVLKSIRDYVKTNFNNKKIVRIEIDNNRYELELIDGTDLIFNRSGQFIKID